jgi:general secretion pathway protein G
MLLQHRRDSKRTLRAAFTLMEVLVVVAILVVLAGIGIVAFRYLEDSKENIAYVNIKKLEQAVESYKLNPNHGDYPANLQILTERIDGKPAYLEESALKDPWGRPYVYEPQQRHPKTDKPLIYSQGANPGQSAPIRNWK